MKSDPLRAPHPDPFQTPDWVAALLPPQPQGKAGLMDVAIALACESARHGGGPFGAVLADSRDGRIIACGWNQVLPQRDSTWHAEIHCIWRAQRALKTHNLREGPSQFTLFSSSSPCIQCFGAIYWSGISSVVAGARCSDAADAGFDEGPIYDSLWLEAARRKGISFEADFQREKALQPFRVYKELGGIIY